jgi:hypothetical protein
MPTASTAAGTRRQPKKSTVPDPLDVSRRFTVRKRVVTEVIWEIPEGIGGRQEAREYAEEMKPQKVELVSEHWLVEQESKSDVVRRLFGLGKTATEIVALTGWDYGFVYGVSWRDTGGRFGR